MGEFELIERITAELRQGTNVRLGPGDDAALLEVPGGAVLASTDMLVEGVHFRLDWTTPFALGRRAAAQNFADIAAMGGTPTALLVAVAAPKSSAGEWFTELARGFQAECDLVGASVIGGDLSSGTEHVVAVTVLGELAGSHPVTRSGAAVGDVVAVAGRLGWSACGLLALQQGIDADAAVLDAYRAPNPPYSAGPEAAMAGATSMIDVSDGLLADAGHIADASGVTLALESVLLQPADHIRQTAERLGVAPLSLVLTGGEDHALLATFPGAAAVPASFRVVGRVVARAAHAVLVDAAPVPGLQGHDHFG